MYLPDALRGHLLTIPLVVLVPLAVLALSILGSIWAVTAAFARLSYRAGQIELKVETLWDFIVRRAKVEAVKMNWGTLSSPIHLNVRGLEVIQPFLDQFLPFYVDLLKRTPPATEQDMYVEFERKFGDFIMEKICIPYGVTEGACLVAIVSACKVAHERG